ncbi:MAG: 2-hydroxyacyl-CoA dehydratase [Chloroflexota bacterium]
MSAPSMSAIEKLRQAVQDRHRYAREWKARTGGKVVGYLCSYVPEEIISAAGMLPVRVFGSREPQDVTEPHIASYYCPYCRDCLAQALLGRYDYLDGLVIGHSCFHILQTFNSWRRHVPLSFDYHLFVPQHVRSPRAKPCLTEVLVDFQAALQEWSGQAVTDGALDGAIAACNHNRRLLHQLYQTRKDPSPPITGAQAMEVVLASQVMDKGENSQLREQVLSELPGTDGAGEMVRLMVVGSENNDVELLRLTESLGARVVVDDHCTGSRYFWNEVIPGPNRLEAIAARYIDRVPCPQKDLVEKERLPHILKLAQGFGVQGAILIQEKFCDPHGFDMPQIQALLKANGIPSLLLEVDITTPAGQFRTRLEAFLEMLQTGTA